MATNEELHAARIKRIHDAVELKEPDRVPIIGWGTQTFFAMDAGYTVAECIYDYDKAKDAIRKFLTRYEPDAGCVLGTAFEGQGQILDLLQPTTLLWAGMAGRDMDPNGVHQFIEFELLEEDELHELADNFNGCFLTKVLPRAFKCMEPMKHFNLDDTMNMTMGSSPVAGLMSAFSNPEVKQMIETLQKAQELQEAFNAELFAFIGEVEGMGFPVMTGAPTFCSYDFYSDYLRGTMSTSQDLYENPEYLKAFMDHHVQIIIDRIAAMPPIPGRMCFMPMHKGMDGFMSEAQYERFYWKPFRKMIDALIDVGVTPYLYTEGPYDSRLDFLTDVPKGKTMIHFEKADMKRAKQKLEGIACIVGNLSVTEMEFGRKETVIEETRRLLDDCMPGGGYIFDFNGSLENAKPENVDAMFETLEKYGKY